MLTPWPHPSPPTESRLRQLFAAEGLSPYAWSNGPGDRYAPHTHTYHKVIYCVTGSIRFNLPATDDSIELSPGDRLDLPPNIEHSATVGPSGVLCLEAHR